MKILWAVLTVVGVIVVLLILLFAIRSYWAQDTVPNLGVDEAGRLKSCPPSPNCVSSQAEDKAHAMKPWQLASSLTAAEVLQAIRKAAENVGNVRWHSETASDIYLHGVFRTSLFRFPDDVEFFVDSSNGLIHFRSASRVGHSDLGANRKRMKLIREELEKIIGN